MKNLRLLFIVVTTVLSFVKKIRKCEEEALSDESAVKFRLKLEALAAQMEKGQDAGWRKYLNIDDPAKLLRFVRLALKSAKLDAIENGSTLERIKAKEVLDKV